MDKVISDECEIEDFENTFRVFYCGLTQEFIATENVTDKPPIILIYELVHRMEYLLNNTEIRKEVLEYCLGRYTPEDIISERDIFLHGEYTIKK